MGKITFLARTSLLVIFLLGSSINFLSANYNKAEEISISGTVVNASCFEGSDGSVSITVSGGNGNYSYSWNTGATTKDISNLNSGTYSLTVTDSENNTATENFVVNQPAVLNASVASTEVSCFEINDGTITISGASGGSGNYQFSINNGSSWQDSGNFTGLANGTYQVLIRDSDSPNCSISLNSNLTISQPAVLNASVASTDVTCFEANDGSITISGPSGGSGNYQFSINNGSSWQDAGNFTGLSNGTYQVLVRDSGSPDCSIALNSNLTISQPAVLNASVASTDVTCFGASDGTITITSPSGGSGVYQFSINNGNTWQDAGNFTGLANGTYQVLIRDKDNTGCTISLNSNLAISQPAVLNASVASTDVTCFGANDGTITITNPSGGSGNYQFSINNGSSWQDSGNFTNLSNGNYQVLIRDSGSPDCSIALNSNLTISQPAVLNASVASTNVTCFGANDGLITITNPTGGYGNYQFSINNGSSWQDSGNFTGLANGTYQVLIRDKDNTGCTIILNSNLIITQPSILSANIESTNITCATANDGSITINTPTGGYGTYEFSINSGSTWQSSEVFNGLSDGTYNISIRDQANPACVQILNSHYEIVRPFALTADVSKQDISCNGANDGTITISNASGGFGNFQYSIDGSNWQPEAEFSNLTNRTYPVFIRDVDNTTCIVELESALEITQPSPLTSGIASKTDVLCNGLSTGEVTATATGGTAPYTFSWGSLGPGETKSNLRAGVYTVTVTDANGCSTEPLSVEIFQPATFIEITSTRTTSGCFQQNNGTARVETTGGTGQHSYLWSNGQTTQTATGLAPGNHTVTVTDENGCSKSRVVTVSAPTQLQIIGFLTTETTTYGTATGTATAQVSGGTPTYSFQWSNGQTTQTARNLLAGNYSVVVTDQNGCSVTRQVTIIDTLDATILPTSICEGEEEIVRTSYFEVEDLTARGGTPGYTYSWNFGEFATPATATGPGPHKVKYSVIGDKRITLKVTDSKGITLEKQIIQYVGGCFSNDCGSNDLQAENYFVGDAFGNKITNQNCAASGQKYLYVVIPTNSSRYSLNIEYIYSIKNLSTGVIYNGREAGCFYRKVTIPDVARTIPIDYTCGDVIKIEGIYLTFSNNNNWDCGQGPNPKCYSTNNETSVTIPLYAVAFPNDLLCNGGLNGEINARASGGTGTYTYKLISSPSGSTVRIAQPSSSFTGLPAGKYKVVVSDGIESYTTAEVEILQPVNPLRIEVDSQTEITCFMGSDGTATVQAYGGTPGTTGEEYIYVWDNGQTTATATNLTAGTYSVRVIDVNGCEVETTVTIAQPAEIIAVAGPDQLLSCGTTSINLQAEYTSPDAEGGAESFGEWTIVNGPAGASFADANDPNTLFSGAQGTYTLRWTVPCGASDDVNISLSYCSTLDFDGINDHIDFSDNFNLPVNFTLEAWVKQDATTSSGIKTILSKRNISNLTEGGYDLIVENNIPKFRWNGSSIISQYPIGTDRWYHIAVIKGGANEGLYIDGIKTSNSGASPGSPSAVTSRFLIGAAHDAITPEVPGNYFHGWIEEVRIWKTALNLEQLHFMMNQKVQNNEGQVKGLEIPLNVPGNLTWDNLLGYYQLGIVENGYTLSETTGSPKGKLINITTTQQRTAPLPYISNKAGQWFADDTWLRPIVWDPPNSVGVDGSTRIDWNIARISHNINSGGKNIEVLGLLSKSGKLTIANPNESLNEKNSGQSLTVTHYLQLNGVIDLVGESQLIQTDIDDTQSIISVLDGASTGYIERDQQGTANSYNYNYWSSPVSLQGAANNSTYTIKSVMKDGTNSASTTHPDLSFQDWHEYADGPYSTPRKISNYWLHKFRGMANVYSEWERVGSTGVLNAGEGYTMKGTSGHAKISDSQNYVFKGKPNNGTIPLNVGQDQNYLLGNPFPSAIDINKFILDNLNKNVVNGATNTSNIFNGAVYFWDHFAGGNTHILKEYIGGYATRNLIDGVPAISNDERVNANDQNGNKIPGQYIPVAQGFFINTVLDPTISANITVSGGDVVFRNYQRQFVTEQNAENSQFLRPEINIKSSEKMDVRAKIRLDYKSPRGYYRQILVGVDPNTTSGFDLGYDAPLNDYVAEDMFWLINEREYVIQGVPDFNIDRVLPLGIITDKAGELLIKINKLENVSREVNIFLYDKVLDSYYNLRKGEFVLEIEPGLHMERFSIVFKEKINETPGEEVVVTPPVVEKPGSEIPGEETLIGDPEVFYRENDRQLLVKNPELEKINKITLHSLSGQIIEEYTSIATQKEVKLPVRSYSSSIYIVKMHTDRGIVYKKMIINN